MSQSSIKDILPAKLFHDQMITYMEEYLEYLLVTKSDPTVVSQRIILQQAINYLFNEHLVKDFNEISPEMLKFGNLSQKGYPDLTSQTPPEIILDTLGDFFEFLYGKYGLRNESLQMLPRKN